MATKKHPGKKLTERQLRKQGFRFVERINVGWKIFDDEGHEYSWLEYRFDPHVDRIHLYVDKLRDGAANFARLVTAFHGVALDY